MLNVAVAAADLVNKSNSKKCTKCQNNLSMNLNFFFLFIEKRKQKFIDSLERLTKVREEIKN